MALALGDALSMVISDDLHLNVSAVFSKNHPGGAIGAAFMGPRKISDLAIPLLDIPEVEKSTTGAQVLISAYRSKNGWVRQGQGAVISPRRIKMLQSEDMDEAAIAIKDLVVPAINWINVPLETSLSTAQEWIKTMRRTDSARTYNDDAILALVDEDEVFGIMEIGDLM